MSILTVRLAIHSDPNVVKKKGKTKFCLLTVLYLLDLQNNKWNEYWQAKNTYYLGISKNIANMTEKHLKSFIYRCRTARSCDLYSDAPRKLLTYRRRSLWGQRAKHYGSAPTGSWMSSTLFCALMMIRSARAPWADHERGPRAWMVGGKLGRPV